MLSTPLAAAAASGTVEFSCFYFVQSYSSRRPGVSWFFNHRFPADRRLDTPVEYFGERHSVSTTEEPCMMDYLKHRLNHCFRSTLTISWQDPPRNVRYGCETWMNSTDGSVENRLTAFYQLTSRHQKSDIVIGLSDIGRYNEGCDDINDAADSLDRLISDLNACDRNSFLQMSVSPTDANNTVLAQCSRPFYLHFAQPLRFYRLPPDVGLLRQLWQENKLALKSQDQWRFPKHFEVFRGSENGSTQVGGKRYVMYDAFLQGNITLVCDRPNADHVVVCAYGPTFKMVHVSTNCSAPEHISDTLVSTIVCTVLAVCLISATAVFVSGRRYIYHISVWTTVEECTARVLAQSRFQSPRLPPPITSLPTSATSNVDEYVKLDERRWSLSGRCLRLGERIAEGSYGDVFKGLLVSREAEEHRQVVIKTLNDVFSRESVLEFANEVAILRLIGPHPTIIHFIGCAQRTSLNNRPALVTEYAHNGTLQNYLRGLRPKPETCLLEVIQTHWQRQGRALVSDLYSFATDVASALIYLEKLAVAHSDVAARNVLLTASLTAKLNDFGLACVIPHGQLVEDKPIYYNLSANAADPSKCTRLRRIPVRWSAPEVLETNQRHARSDVWSFGVLLWEIFSLGENPYAGLKTEEDVAAFVLHSKGRLLKPVLASRELYRVMNACWTESVCDRPDFRRVFKTLQDLNVEVQPARLEANDSTVHV
uniref:Protein kinase domain-containing protein n=2 Tax=Mesocestoides corti TaxID=53468 RepID=A0A5K3FYP4_MESCO